MPKTKPKTLKPAVGLAGIVARPGAAARPAESVARTAGQEGHGAPATVASGAPRALTVKLAPDLYRRLRLHAVTHDTTHQAAMVAALLEYLERHK